MPSSADRSKSCARRGKFNVYEEIISLQFSVHDASYLRICKQCLRKLEKRHGIRTMQAFRRKPAKETKIFIYPQLTEVKEI